VCSSDLLAMILAEYIQARRTSRLEGWLRALRRRAAF